MGSLARSQKLVYKYKLLVLSSLVRRLNPLTLLCSGVNEYLVSDGKGACQIASAMRLTGCSSMHAPLGVERVPECNGLPWDGVGGGDGVN